MSEDRRRILDMLEQGKITALEAERLLDAIEPVSSSSSDTASKLTSKPDCQRKLRYLCITVDDTRDGEKPKRDKVDIRVPLQFLGVGKKLAAFIPKTAQSTIDKKLKEKGINLNLSDISPENIDEFVDGLAGLSLDVDGKGKGKVRIFCE